MDNLLYFDSPFAMLVLERGPVLQKQNSQRKMDIRFAINVSSTSRFRSSTSRNRGVFNTTTRNAAVVRGHILGNGMKKIPINHTRLTAAGLKRIVNRKAVGITDITFAGNMVYQKNKPNNFSLTPSVES